MSSSEYWQKIIIDYNLTSEELDLMFFHRKSVGHRAREVCEACPQPITGKIVKYWEGEGVHPRKTKKMGIYN